MKKILAVFLLLAAVCSAQIEHSGLTIPGDVAVQIPKIGFIDPYPDVAAALARLYTPTSVATITYGNRGAALTTGTYKYIGGALASNGKIYCPPRQAQNILVIDPVTGTATETNMGATLPSGDLYSGAVRANNGKIYCPPRNAQNILIIDPENNTATTTTGGVSFSTTDWKYNSAILASNGKIYCPPMNTDAILVIDPETDTATTTNMGASMSGTYQWWTGLEHSDGKIYCCPSAATTMLIIDPVAGVATTSNMGLGNLVGNASHCGGVIAGDGSMYFVPRNGVTAAGIRISVTNGVASAAVTDNFNISLDQNKYASAVAARDGFVYPIAYSLNGDGQRLNPFTGAIEWAFSVTGGDNYFYGSVQDANGDVWVVPYVAQTIPKITFSSPASYGRYNWVPLSPKVNKSL